MKNIILVFFIINFSSLAIAQTFQPNIKIKQTNISTATNIEVGINLSNYPCLVPYLTEPYQALFRNGNQLELVVIAIGAMLCNPIALDDPPHQYYNIGALEEGIYDLRVRIVSNVPFFEPFADTGFVFGIINGMQVNPVVIPTLGIFSLILLIAGLLLLAGYKINSKSAKLTTLLILTLVVNNVLAEKIFHIVLSDHENAPSADGFLYGIIPNLQVNIAVISTLNIAGFITQSKQSQEVSQ